MLGFLPIFILLGAAIAVAILQFVPKGTGIAWMVSVAASISTWALVLIIKSRLPFSFSDHIFLALGIESAIPAFQFDIIIWPFVLTICGLVIGTLIVSSARIGLDSTCWEWAGILFLGALGIFGCLSANLLTVLVVLGLFDLVDVIILFLSGEPGAGIRETLKHTTWRLISIILFLTAFAWQNSLTGSADDWKSLVAGPLYLILAGCMLRMALIPSTKLTGIPRISSNGLFVIRFIIGFLITTSIVIKLPFPSDVSIGKNILIVYLFIIACSGALWLLRNKEREQPIAWQAFAGSLVCAEYIYGFSAAGILFISSAAVLSLTLFLDYPVSKFSKGIGLLALIGFSGLPFTPNNTGLSGFTWSGQIPGFIFLLPAVLAFLSFLRKTWRKESLVNPMGERWANMTAPAGFIFPVITPWIISFSWVFNKLALNLSIQALIMTLAALVLFVADTMHVFNMDILFTQAYAITDKVKHRFNTISTFNNISFEGVIRQPFTFITELFEGDGGILWAILCLVLVITILQSLGLS